MRIAVLGLGDIAQKAYLPLLCARADLELVLCSRNTDTLHRLGAQYRIGRLETELARLPGHGVQAAFVHTATAAHVEVASRLLELGIDVYLDKPLAYHLAEAEALVALAERHGRLLMIGFNRRFAPLYRELQQVPQPHLVLMQKNRLAQPAAPREFIFDDFIHVVDTLRFLAPAAIERIEVASRQDGGLLQHVAVQLFAAGFSAIGIMNRDSGASEESLELMSAGHKRRVENLDSLIHHQAGQRQQRGFGDWEPVLRRRGFEAIIEHFLGAVRTGRPTVPSAADALQTHALCEQIVQAIGRSA